MHSAATDGIEGSPGAGRIAFDASWRIFPGVSEPSSVVRSQHLNARSSAHILESFLIDRFASDAARSVAPTASTEPPMRLTSSSGCCVTVATDGLLPLLSSVTYHRAEARCVSWPLASAESGCRAPWHTDRTPEPRPS